MYTAASEAGVAIEAVAALARHKSLHVAQKPGDRYLVRDGQRVIEAIEALVRIHSAQEEDIYERVAIS